MAPSGGGGGGGASLGRRGGGGTDTSRRTFIAWKEAVLKKPGVATGDEAASADDQLRKMLHVDDCDPRPTLLYFHRNHFEDGEGKPWAKQCKEFEDEDVARWMGLYVCVEVDIDKSDPGLLERFGAQDGPSFAVVDGELAVRATSGELKSGKRVVSFLETTAKKEFAAYWETVQERIDDQQETLRKVKSLMKQKEYERARDHVREITYSDLRIGKVFEEAVQTEEKLDRELDD